MLVLFLLLAIAMALTLWFGREGGSRHGYGRLSPLPAGRLETTGSGSAPENRVTPLCPGINPATQIVDVRIALAREEVDDLGTA